jgi:hypothetical protein
MKKFLLICVLLLLAGCNPTEKCYDHVVYVKFGSYGFTAKFKPDSTVETCGYLR